MRWHSIIPFLLAASTTVHAANPLEGLYGKGVVISYGGRFWNAENESRLIKLEHDNPEEYFGRYFAVPVPDDPNDAVYFRLGDFQYICLQGPNNNDQERFLHAVTREDFEEDGYDRDLCKFIVEEIPPDSGVVPIRSDGQDRQFSIKAKKTNKFVTERFGGVAAWRNDIRPDIDRARIRDEKDVVVDLEVLEQFFTNNKEEDEQVEVKLRLENQNLVDVEWAGQGNWHFRANQKLEGNIKSRWTISRKSLLSNVIYVKNADPDVPGYLCQELARPSYAIVQNINSPGEHCEWIPIRAGSGQFYLFHPIRERFVNISGGKWGVIDSLYTDDALKISVELADRVGSALEIVDIDFDRLAIQSVPFSPNEVKTIQFTNNSPVDQEQVVELNESKTVSVETSWSVAFSVESSVTVETSVSGFFAKGSVSASLTVGFSSEYGRTFSTEKTIGINYSKAFVVPACSKVDIIVATSAAQRSSLPFIATIRQTNVDGSVKIFRQTGTQTGIVLDQTEVTVETTPIEDCGVATNTRRALRGNMD